MTKIKIMIFIRTNKQYNEKFINSPKEFFNLELQIASFMTRNPPAGSTEVVELDPAGAVIAARAEVNTSIEYLSIIKYFFEVFVWLKSGFS